jgi:hypothetical protein
MCEETTHDHDAYFHIWQQVTISKYRNTFVELVGACVASSKPGRHNIIHINGNKSVTVWMATTEKLPSHITGLSVQHDKPHCFQTIALTNAICTTLNLGLCFQP